MKTKYNKEKRETQIIVTEPASITVDLTLAEAAAIAAAIANVRDAKLKDLLYDSDNVIRMHTEEALKSGALFTLYSELIDFLENNK